jgi:hypothetical protein
MQIAQGPYSQHYTFSITYECALYYSLYYKTSMIVIYDGNDSGQYYKTTVTIIFMIVFTILAKVKAKAKAGLR